ncbi:hypothetical protein PTSG_05090 [Salpingoeca rosetta]|uniref:Eukaryotic translation initiation factor 3 subunit 7 n=1 Tax=Salpingoeca rosetta (strain ATCC 50818 / BSB-021) TaxID=946362 RepID=F2UAH9_SALR5|nr:uncharacterized protein PTSG_05090 [Salpingoeca rosetta]EGD73395.1 hypothetical protein PTSG_05090 [Salpingoeca rosetta]|eukprot:XP_004993677.1 hypothetical protein PTSG_05090 [Salpingoeca rosetta]
MSRNKNIMRDRQRQERQLRAKWNAAAKRRGERYQHRSLGPSTEIKAHWDIIRELEFSKLAKPFLEVEPPKDLHLAGDVHVYNPGLNTIRPKTAKRLHIPARSSRHVALTTSADPVMKTFMEKDAASVFITDDILAAIMVAARSFYSWDVIVHKEGERLVFDKREKSRLDYLTVNENGPNPHFSTDPRHPNHQLNLNREATFVNQHFQEQCWSKETVSMGNPDPTNAARHKVGYRYRLWDLEDDVTMLVRCTHDALVKGKTAKYFASLCSINEWYPDLRQNGWRSRLESQKGAVWAAALKDNSCKISRWVVQAMLAGNRELKMGFVSRASPNSATKHEILTVQPHATAKLAKQLAINMQNGWGIVRSLVDLLLDQEDGDYLIFKDPLKEILKIIAIPENDEEELEGEEGDEGDEEEQEEDMLDDEEFI